MKRLLQNLCGEAGGGLGRSLHATCCPSAVRLGRRADHALRKDLQSTLETCTAYPPELSRLRAPTCNHDPAAPQTITDYNLIHDLRFGWRCKAKF